jgi:hypothetical protein
MAAAKPEVVSNLEINSLAGKFRRISTILLDIYVAEIIAERLMHKGNCETAKFKITDWKPEVVIILHI